MTLSVIGAGFGRTGTESMKQALEILGFGPCYHMVEVLPHQDRVDIWRKAAAGTLPDWDQVFAGFRATVDWPGAYYWRQLSAHYPEAKILLTWRDPESWYRSMEKTILPVLRNSTEPDSVGSRLLAGKVFGNKLDEKDHLIAVYEKNVADVQAAFDDDRLLTYKLGDGWQPLCDFLGCAIPDVDYPNKNNPVEFDKTVKRLEAARKAT